MTKLKTYLPLLILGLFMARGCAIPLLAQTNPYETHILKRIKNGITALDIHPDGTRILFGTGENQVKAWHYREDQLVFEIPMSREIFSVKYLPDGKYFLANAGPAIRIYAEAGDYHNVLQGHNTAIWSMDTDPSGTFLVSGSFSKEFNIWNVLEVQLIESVKDHNKSVLAVCFSPDGQHLASGSLDETIQIHAFPSLELELSAVAHSENIYDLEYHPDGNLLASASRDRSIKLWNLETGRVVHHLEGHNGSVFSIGFSPDGLFLISGSEDQTIKLWEVSTGNLVYTFTGHEGPVNALHFLPDGTGFVSGSMDETIRVWQLHPEIVVHYCCKAEIDAAIQAHELFEPQREEESKSDYKQRINAQEALKISLYQEYYDRYIQRSKKD